MAEAVASRHLLQLFESLPKALTARPSSVCQHLLNTLHSSRTQSGRLIIKITPINSDLVNLQRTNQTPVSHPPQVASTILQAALRPNL